MRKLIFLLPIILLSACSGLWEYRSLHELKDHTWKKSEVLSYDAEISQDGTYDVFILFRHVQGFPYKDMGIHMEMNGNDIDLKQDVLIPVIGENKKYLGDGSVDIWDIEHKAFDELELKAGNYHIDLTHLMQQADLGLVMEVGIMIKKTTSE